MKPLILLLTLAITSSLTGCGSTIHFTVEDRDASSETRIANLKELRKKFATQEAWAKEINTTTRVGRCYSPLDCAIRNRDIATAGYLLWSGANPGLNLPKPFYNSPDTPYPMQRAILVSKSDKEAKEWVELLSLWGSPPNYATRDNSPALIIAIKRHYPETVKRLLFLDNAKTGPVQAQDPPTMNPGIAKHADPLPTYSSALVFAVNEAREDSAADKAIIKALLKAGADPFDMRFAEGTPSLPAYAIQKGKPKLAEYTIQAYAEVHRLNASQLAEFRQELEKHAQLAVARKEAHEEAERNRLARIHEQESRKVIDDSNSWAGTATQLIQEAGNQYEIMEQSKLPPESQASSNPGNTQYGTPHKRIDTSCQGNPNCQSTSYNGPYIFTKKVTAEGRGRNNAVACADSRNNASPPYNACFEGESAERKMISTMGYALDACICNELEFKSTCHTSATYYCGNPNPSNAHGVQVE